MTDRKKPTAGFWITVALVAVLVGYPLSFGPACWISSRTNSTGETESALPVNLYQPISSAMSRSEGIAVASTGTPSYGP